jgi:caffeoyl-CoA O-methyltransferase
MADFVSREGARYSTPALVKWVDDVHAAHDSGLSRAFESPERDGLPAIQVAPSEGKLLEMFVRLIRARKVVEVGTLAGYSTLRLARGLGEDGRVWSIEADERHAEIACANISAARMDDRVEVLVGRGLDVLPRLEAHGPFDAVFIDADKENYDAYGRWAAKNTRRGGLLLGDNAYFFGRLMEESPAAEAMRRFHQEAVVAYDTVCVSTPDGLLLGIKR